MDPRGTVGGIYKKDYYTLLPQNRKALCHVVSEKTMCLCISHCKSMEAFYFILFFFLPQGHGWQEGHYTLLYTKYKSSGPDGFVDKEFFLRFFSDDALPPPPPGRGLYRPQEHGWQNL